VHGPEQIVRSYIATIEETGGRVLVRALVEEILVNESNVAIGVRMSNGDIINAETVISGAGVFNTYTKLLPEIVKSKLNLSNIIKETDIPSVTHIYGFFGFEGTTEELGLVDYNTWYLPSDNINFDLDELTSKWHSEIPLQNITKGLCFIGFPSAKDPSFQSLYPGKSTCVIITEGKYEWFEKWKNNRQGKRGEDYDQLKFQFMTIFENVLFHYFPKTRDKVRFKDIGTPLSNEFYLNSEKGSSYGMAATVNRFKIDNATYHPKTPIKNLYLTGQDMCSIGVSGAITGAGFTVSHVLGYNTFDMVLLNRSLEKELKNMKKMKKDKVQT